ncbi:MAG: YfiR family protein [Sulfuricella sp.]|nr:YfiR family protein [Sulfuricella sp.]
MTMIGKLCFAQLFFLLAALVCHGGPAIAQDVPDEQAVRAAMVFNFLKFIEFPPETIANVQRIRLCTAVGDPQQAEALAALAGRKVAGRELVVVRLTGRDDDCHALYVDTRQRWNAVEEQRTLRRTLTISAYPGFVRDGGMIEIAVQESGTRFDINMVEGRRAGFYFSANLLRLARRIHE